jgi:2,3-diphosphopglycerate-independent phosphoglycerate mutase
MRKIVFILIDGLGDCGVTEFKFKTPLEHAKTPFMDSLAEYGVCGLMDVVECGLACGSDTAHMNILGYNPMKYYRGRGAFEALGGGLEMKAGDIAFKVVNL